MKTWIIIALLLLPLSLFSQATPGYGQVGFGGSPRATLELAKRQQANIHKFGVTFPVTPNIGLNVPVAGTLNWDVPLNANSVLIDSIFALATCGDATHALGWNKTSKVLFCQTLTGGGAVASVFGQTGVVPNLSGDVSTSNSSVTTLLTVNTNVGSFTNANITVDGKGRVTAAANGNTGVQTIFGTVGPNITALTIGTGDSIAVSGSGTNAATTLLAGTWAVPGTIGSTTPSTGAFTTLAASSTVSGTGFSTYLASPPAIGGTAPAAGTFTAIIGTNVTDSALTPGDCVQAGTGGLLTTTAGACGSGGGGVASVYGATGTITALTVGDGDTLAASGTGTIAATSVPVAGIVGQLLLNQIGTVGLSGTSPLSIAATGVATCLTCVVATVSPSAGIATFAGSTQTVTSTGTSGSGNVVLVTSATLITPALGTPSALVLTNATGLPLSTGVTGQLPIAAVGSAGLSGTSPITINSAGAIGCATCSVLSGLTSGTIPIATSTTGIGNGPLTVTSSIITSADPLIVPSLNSAIYETNLANLGTDISGLTSGGTIIIPPGATGLTLSGGITVSNPNITILCQTPAVVMTRAGSQTFSMFTIAAAATGFTMKGCSLNANLGTGPPIVFNSGTSGAQLLDDTIVGTGSTHSEGVQMNGLTNFIFDNLTITSGVIFGQGNTQNGRIVNSDITNTAFSAIELHSTTNGTTIEKITIQNNHLHCQGTFCVEVGSFDGASPLDITVVGNQADMIGAGSGGYSFGAVIGGAIIGNTFNAGAQTAGIAGIELAPSLVNATSGTQTGNQGGTISGNTLNGGDISLNEASDVTVTTNTVTIGNGLPAVYVGGSAGLSTNNNNVTNNTLICTAACNTGAGGHGIIWMQANNAAESVSNNAIAQNLIIGSGTGNSESGIYGEDDSGTMTGNQVTGNIFNNMAVGYWFNNAGSASTVIAYADSCNTVTTCQHSPGTNVTYAGFSTPNYVSAGTYKTLTNCSSAASPAVCGSASAGSVVVAAAATTVVVDTTAVTANSNIFIQPDDSLGTNLSVTCNTTGSLLSAEPWVSARTAGTSFTISVTSAPSTNPECFSYHIVN